MVNINDIPKELLESIRKAFEADQRIIMLRVNQRMLQEAGNFAQALSTGKQIESLFQETVAQYLKEADEIVEKKVLSDIGLSDEEAEKFMQYTMVMFMACDIIESAVMDAEDIIHKHEKDFSFEEFIGVTNIAKEAKAKLEFLQHNSNYMEDLVWVDKCDNMYEMMQSKAKAIMHKRKTDKNYGKNAEKYK